MVVILPLPLKNKPPKTSSSCLLVDFCLDISENSIIDSMNRPLDCFILEFSMLLCNFFKHGTTLLKFQLRVCFNSSMTNVSII